LVESKTVLAIPNAAFPNKRLPLNTDTADLTRTVEIALSMPIY